MSHDDRIPIPKLTGRNLRRPVRMKPSMALPIFRVLVMLVISALFTWFVVSQATDLAYAAGWAGTPITVNQADCVETSCTVQYQPDGPGSDADFLGVTGHDALDPARSYPASLRADGENATLTGTRALAEALRDVSLALLLWVLAFGYGVCLFTQQLGEKQGWWLWGPSKLLKFAPLVLAAFFGLIAGISAIIVANTTL